MANINILLADDDQDDRILFQDALSEIQIPSSLCFATNGDELIKLLKKNSSSLPDILFLDLNMPLKTGAECLADIQNCEHLNKIPVVIFSTSYSAESALELQKNGASYYIQKPAEFSALKAVIKKVLSIVTENSIENTSKKMFLIEP